MIVKPHIASEEILYSWPSEPLSRQDSAHLGLGDMEHSFSVEMKSKRYVRRISISDEGHDRVFFEGFLGELRGLSLVEGRMLEVVGTNGVLRIDLSEDELRAMKTSPS